MGRAWHWAVLAGWLATLPAEAVMPPSFRVRLAEDLGTLDWNYGEVSPEIVYQLMEGLFRTDAKGRPVKAVAESFHWNAARTDLRVKLRANRKWSDGTPVCAQHFVDSWERLRSKEFASPYAHYAHVLKSFSADGCRNLQISFTRSAPEATALLAHYVFFPVRKEQLSDDGKIFRTGAGLLVNGPYQVQAWQGGRWLNLERNLHFGGKTIGTWKVQYVFVPEDATAKTMFDQSSFDWVRDVPALLRTPELEKSPAFRVFPSFTSYYFGVNAKVLPALADANLRLALSAALDRAELPKVLGAEYRGSSTWLTKELFPALRAPQAPKVNWEAAKAAAKTALAAGLKLRVYAKGNHKLLAEWAQAQWEKKLGVRVPIEVRESKVYWGEIAKSPAPLFLSGVIAPYAHPRAYLQEFLSASTANWTGWSSAEYDADVEAGRFQAAEERLAREVPIIPLYSRRTVALVAPGWRGFRVNPLGQVFLNEVESTRPPSNPKAK